MMSLIVPWGFPPMASGSLVTIFVTVTFLNVKDEEEDYGIHN